ncbi:RNA-directed DNA polymerase [Sessilibacter corallicola]|uniref:RNA-directed DNA polymerase n=1 Tax=Sessilibacter corallicola TaxID=2904075 RepID=A0ABQ0AEW8_9GAMM
MGLLDKKYRQLEPTDEYLSDKVILAQAWKKTQTYIRSTNWYSNTFELDQSTLSLATNLEDWHKELKLMEYELTELRLVPAPKSMQWEFVKSQTASPFGKESNDQHGAEEASNGLNQTWQPKRDSKNETDKLPIPPLRPLAHIPIKEQTYFTSLMMCIANIVESAQGDSETHFSEVHEKNVVNYGNRLYCRYKDNQAYFSWGNSTVYSKYFKDYQRFLERSYYFAKNASKLITDKERVYEIHLDLKSFYDLVDREKLTRKITKLIDNVDKPLRTNINYLLGQFESWNWDSDSEILYKDTCQKESEEIPMGIPQGLVSGGFFANIYLLDFDMKIAKLIGNLFKEKYRLVDYCRYVDDMRLVLITEEKKIEPIKEDIESFFNEKLDEINLSLNEKKTKVEPFRSRRTGISQKLKLIQSKVSGPISNNEVDEQLGHLEGLMNLADYIKGSASEFPSTNPLALIEAPSHDVREDTLVRFAANKIHALLKQKRSFYTQELTDKKTLKPGNWDYLQERMARKFIACWAKDPSLVLLLKKGLELFPKAQIVNTIIEQLKYVIKRDDKKQKCVANYCLGEIFRHSATVIHGKIKWAFPAHSNRSEFFEYLQCLAVEILQSDPEKYTIGVKEQARFLLLVRNDTILNREDKSDKNFNTISKFIKGHRTITNDMTMNTFISNALLAHQLAQNKNEVIRSVSSFLDGIFKRKTRKWGKKQSVKKKDFRILTERLARESPVFLKSLVKYSRKNRFTWQESYEDIYKKAGLFQNSIVVDDSVKDRKYPLIGVITGNENPFQHENAVLLLLLECLDNYEFTSPVDVLNSTISCSNWSKIQSLSPDIKLKADIKEDGEPLFAAPDWVRDDHEPLYHIGMFLRTCLIGSLDWSSHTTDDTNCSQYKGIKSGFLKRQFGMMHSPESLNGQIAPMSSWLSSLLFHLLQWPGLEIYEQLDKWPKEWNLNSLKKLISARLEEQRKLFCVLSGIPSYVEKVDLGWDIHKKDLEVIMVQSLLPQKSDFSEHGLKLDTEQYRVKHRRHTASVAELILHKKHSHESLNKSQNSKIDLIVWPELGVNSEDIDILKRLSDKTGAIIFTGLNFMNIPGIKGPNNVAKWIIPNKRKSGRNFIERLQGKQNMMADEIKHIKPWRPYQLLIELIHPAFKDKVGFRLTGSVCYDATDIAISADLKDKSNAYLIPALNRDVNTFDSMVDALFYHMYQHVVLVNTGEFGGSVAKAPYKEKHEKLITHVHGAQQVSISSFKMNMFDFRKLGSSYRSGKKIKTKPAG